MEDITTTRGDELIERLSKKLDGNSRNSIQRDLNGLFLHPEWWHVRAIPGLSTKHFDSLTDFITYRYPWGLGWTMHVAEAFILPELPEIWQAIQGELPAIAKHGVNQHNEGGSIPTSSERGREYQLRRLKRDNPVLAEKVVNGELSANAAFIEAGLGKKKISHEASVEGFAKSILKHLDNHQIEELLQLL